MHKQQLLQQEFAAAGPQLWTRLPLNMWHHVLSYEQLPTWPKTNLFGDEEHGAPWLFDTQAPQNISYLLTYWPAESDSQGICRQQFQQTFAKPCCPVCHHIQLIREHTQPITTEYKTSYSLNLTCSSAIWKQRGCKSGQQSKRCKREVVFPLHWTWPEHFN